MAAAAIEQVQTPNAAAGARGNPVRRLKGDARFEAVAVRSKQPGAWRQGLWIAVLCGRHAGLYARCIPATHTARARACFVGAARAHSARQRRTRAPPPQEARRRQRRGRLLARRGHRGGRELAQRPRRARAAPAPRRSRAARRRPPLPQLRAGLLDYFGKKLFRFGDIGAIVEQTSGVELTKLLEAPR